MKLWFLKNLKENNILYIIISSSIFFVKIIISFFSEKLITYRITEKFKEKIALVFYLHTQMYLNYLNNIK